MTFALVNLVMLGLAVVGAAVALRASGRRGGVGRRDPCLRPLLLTLVGLALLTVVFDNLMIAADLFRFDDALLMGVRLGLAPIEDLGYALIALLLVAALWRLLPSRGRGVATSPSAEAADA